MNINVNITNKHCAVQGAPVIVCGNSDYTMTFTFDAEWDNAGEKTARFSYIRDGVRRYQDVKLEGDKVAVPPVYGTKGLQVGVYSGDLVTSTPGRIPCEKSIICGTVSPEDLYPGPAQELRTEMDQMTGLMTHLAGLVIPEAQNTTTKVLQMVPYGPLSLNIYRRVGTIEFDAAEVTVCGKNLYDRETYPLDTDGYPYSSTTATGTFSQSTSYKRTDFIPVAHLAGQTIVLSHSPNATNPGMCFYTHIPNISDKDACKAACCGSTNGASIKVPDNAAYMVFCVKQEDATADVQIEIGNVTTTYEPYSGESHIVYLYGDVVTFGCPPTSSGVQTAYARGMAINDEGDLGTPTSILNVATDDRIDLNGTIAALVDKVNALTASCLIAPVTPAADGGADE